MDNVVAESFSATLKAEVAINYPSRKVAKHYLFSHLETFDNRQRRYPNLGYLFSAAFEESTAKRRLTDLL